MKELPEFKTQRREFVTEFLRQVFTHPNQDRSHFVRLVEYPDGHYSAVFSLSYFASGDEPTKSQWNSVKKKLKRHDKRIFVFKDHSVIDCDASARCGSLDFGFFAHPASR
jgi:hypothetical protein